LGNNWEKAGEFMAYIRERAGLLIRHKPDAYTFPHRTFQEFLAACRLASRNDFPAVAAQLIKDDWDRWREVLILAVGYAARTDRLWSAIATLDNLLQQDIKDVAAPQLADWRNAMLVGEALLEVGQVSAQREKPGQRLYTRAQDWLLAALITDKKLPEPQRAEAGRILSRLGDPRFDDDHWYLPKDDLLGFVHIPGGSFSMGTDKKDIPDLVKAFGGDNDWYKDETPRHTRSLPGFYLGRFPVTNAQFQAFVDAGGYNYPPYWIEAANTGRWKMENERGIVTDWREKWRTGPDNYGEPFILGNHPVVGVTWYEALAYSRWLDERLRAIALEMLHKLGKHPLSPAQAKFWQELAEGKLHVRLPSEAEWERAARGTDGKQYPWGDDSDLDTANINDTGIGSTSAVGCFPAGASAEGAQDLAGNIWEWTRSIYADYPYPGNDSRAELKKREDLSSENLRVLRGGSFFDDRWLARGAFRFRHNPVNQNRYYGFRLVVSLL
jgi:formylglycine-generating enzyme required for sulfatase activity